MLQGFPAVLFVSPFNKVVLAKPSDSYLQGEKTSWLSNRKSIFISPIFCVGVWVTLYCLWNMSLAVGAAHQADKSVMGLVRMLVRNECSEPTGWNSDSCIHWKSRHVPDNTCVTSNGHWGWQATAWPLMAVSFFTQEHVILPHWRIISRSLRYVYYTTFSVPSIIHFFYQIEFSGNYQGL